PFSAASRKTMRPTQSMSEAGRVSSHAPLLRPPSRIAASNSPTAERGRSSRGETATCSASPSGQKAQQPEEQQYPEAGRDDDPRGPLGDVGCLGQRGLSLGQTGGAAVDALEAGGALLADHLPALDAHPEPMTVGMVRAAAGGDRH